MQPQKPGFDVSDVTGVTPSKCYYASAFNEDLLVFGEIIGHGPSTQKNGRAEQGVGAAHIEFFSDAALKSKTTPLNATFARLTATDHTGTRVDVVARQTSDGIEFTRVHVGIYRGPLLEIPADDRLKKVLSAVSGFLVRLNPGAPKAGTLCIGDVLAREFGTSDGHTIAMRVAAGGRPVVEATGGGAGFTSRAVQAAPM